MKEAEENKQFGLGILMKKKPSEVDQLELGIILF